MKKYSIKLISCLFIFIASSLMFNVFAAAASDYICNIPQKNTSEKQMLKSYRKNEIRKIKKKIAENETHMRNLENIRKNLDESLLQQMELHDNLMFQISNYPYKNCSECKILKNQSRYIESKIQAIKRDLRANDRKIEDAKKNREKLEREISNLIKNEHAGYARIKRYKCHVI